MDDATWRGGSADALTGMLVSNLERILASGRRVAQGKEAVCVFQAKAERLRADKRDDGVGVLECG